MNVCRNGARHIQTENSLQENVTLVLSCNATERCAIEIECVIPGTLGIVAALHAIVACASGLGWKSQLIDV